MDELAESLATSFSVSSNPNSTDAPHPRFSEYKRKVSNSNQESRRKEILELQRSRRFDYANHARCLVEDTWDGCDDFDDDDGEDNSMDTSSETKRKTYKPGRYYRNQLMLSEWLVEVPDDFEEEWLMVACPWGKRCLIVSARGATTAYGRNGYRVNSFPSHLPGGNRHQKRGYKENAILDCIYHEVEKTFYVLDVMNWKDNPVYDSDTEFRYFWMMSKLQEFPEIEEISKLNPYKFIPLHFHACAQDNLQQVINSTTYAMDGCLFYHRKAHYTFGRSPLVVWLKPYMLPEILNIEVSEQVLQQKPANYLSYAAHLEEVRVRKEKIAKEQEERKENRKKKRGPDRSQQFKMDLMESKWFTGKPDNFETEWCTVVCPVGQRCLVMAIDGETKWFHKKGFKLPGYFLSVLPGGNGQEYGFGPSVVTMLDCIYYEEMMTYFVLDCILWGSNDITEMGYLDRMKFVRKEMMKIPELKYITELNMFKFVSLYVYDCSLNGLDLALRQSTFDVDGLLFYNKEVQYSSGENDLIRWMKPYMLPDLFEGISVPKKLMSQMPDTYKDFESFVDDVNHGLIKNKKNKKKNNSKKKFVPDVKLDLPPQIECHSKGDNKSGKKNKNKGGNQGKQNGSSHNMGRGSAITGRGRGGHAVGDNYGRLLSQHGGRSDMDRTVYGKGSVTGYSYYGDNRDYYFSKSNYGTDPRGRRDRTRNVDPYQMSDMDAALPYYDNSNRKSARGRQYQLF
ncbi:hypothetical protein ACF0H5_013173 [Mactra antiquata]